MGFDRKATSIWDGDLMSGSGTTTFDTSGAAGPLSMAWNQRAGDEPGSSPEELLAAAHATCYSMALSNILAKGGNPPERLEVSSVVTFSTEGGAHVESSHLTLVGNVPGIDEQAFLDAANTAKEGCPISKALAGNVEITLDARLKN